MTRARPYEHDPEPVSAETLRRVAGAFATGVTAITTLFEGEPRGCAANAVTSLSLEPPLMLACLARNSNTHASLRNSRAFAINILDQSAESRALCRLFASRSTEKFAGVAFERGRTGAPILAVAMGWLECELVDSHDSGDHTIFIGRVLAAGDTERMPLLYFRGRFGSLLPDAPPPEGNGRDDRQERERTRRNTTGRE